MPAPEMSPTWANQRKCIISNPNPHLDPLVPFFPNTVSASGPPHTLALPPVQAISHAESARTAPPPLTNALPQ